MVAFSLGLIVGALGGFFFLGFLAILVRKDELLELPARADGYGELPLDRAANQRAADF